LVDIPLTLSADSTSLDWVNPAVLAQPIDNSLDVQTYVLMLLTTNRVAPEFHYGLLPHQRRGHWGDSYTGEFGSLFWLGTDANQWNSGSKLAQIQRWAEQAVETVYEENMIQAPAQISVGWITNESVQIDINVIVADGTNRAIQFVLST
jgi:phage gp46-like protein